MIRIYPETVDNGGYYYNRKPEPAEMLRSAVDRCLDNLKTLHRKRDCQYPSEHHNSTRRDIIRAYEAYGLPAPKIPIITVAGYLFPDWKAAILRAQEEIKP